MAINDSGKIPTAIRTFAELAMDAILKSNLERAKFVTPTPIQARALGPGLALGALTLYVFSSD